MPLAIAALPILFWPIWNWTLDQVAIRSLNRSATIEMKLGSLTLIAAIFSPSIRLGTP